MIHLFPTRQIALALGPFAIHWYGVMYALAFFIAMLLLPRLERYRELRLTPQQRDAFFVSVILGVLVGGRLGYVLLYAPSYYWAHPLDIFKVWEGGMASHGGFLGVTIALLLWAKKHRVNIWSIADVVVIPVAIGLALGRVGNFINGELYGTITTVPWGMHFPGVEGLRHPTQLYAVVKDVLIALLCFVHVRSTQNTKAAWGQTAALFLILYGLLRFIVEHFRDQPFGFVSLLGIPLSWGQVYTLPIFFSGCLLYGFLRMTRPTVANL